VWRNVTNFLGLMILVPANLYAVSTISSQASFMLPSYIASLGGLAVSEALIRTLERRQRAAAPK